MSDLRPGLIDIPTVATILGVDENTAHRWIELGALRGWPGSDRLLFSRDEVEFMAEPLRGSSADNQAALTEWIPVPARAELRPLFHYTTTEIALDHILRDARLRLDSPVGTNDPFESEPYLVNLSGDSAYPENITDTFFYLNDLLRQCRLTCLSLSGSNQRSSLIGFGDGYARARMWAQYGGNHTGVCLAFDRDRLRKAALAVARERDLRLYAAPVRYLGHDDSAPLIELPIDLALDGPVGLVKEIFPTTAAGLYFTKAWDWSTETEYRLLLHGDVAEYEFVDISSALTGVFCGARFPNVRLDDLRARCPELLAANRIFRLKWRNGFGNALPVLPAGDVTNVGWELPALPLDEA